MDFTRIFEVAATSARRKGEASRDEGESERAEDYSIKIRRTASKTPRFCRCGKSSNARRYFFQFWCHQIIKYVHGLSRAVNVLFSFEVCSEFR